MKNNQKKSSLTLESVNGLLEGVLKEFVDEDLLKRVNHLPDKTACVSFEISQNSEKTIYVRILARHDPFLATAHKTETRHYSIDFIDRTGLTNQLFNTLTFYGSPYFWVKDHFEKKMEVM